MLNYSDLTKGQKRCIDAFISARPELATQAVISTKEVAKLYWELHETRKSGASKIGYPVWLSKFNTVSRGQFAFPAPGLDTTKLSSTVKATATASKQRLQKIVEDSEAVEVDENEFAAELQANGITV